MANSKHESIRDWLSQPVSDATINSKTRVELMTYWNGRTEPHISMQSLRIYGDGASTELTLQEDHMFTPTKLRALAEEIEKHEALIILKGGCEY